VLIGRIEQLEKLERLLAKAALGHGGLCALYGEAGVGKTRLAAEAAERALEQGFLVTWGRASETGGAPAYWPWIELFATVGGDAPESPGHRLGLAATTARSGPGEGMHLDPENERLELFQSVVAFLRERSKQTPLLIVFDDLHMADVASLRLLAYVLRRLQQARIALVATSRDAEARAPGVAEAITQVLREAEVLPLPAFTSAEVEQAVTHKLGAADQGLAAALFDLTQGNPLFLLEALHAILARSRPVLPSDVPKLAVSGGVLAMMRERLSGAGPELLALLETAAVLGREFDAALLAEVWRSKVSRLDAEQGLEAAAQRGILLRRDQDRWAFAHVLVREAFHFDLTAERRAELHLSAARALEGRVEKRHSDDLASLAHHAFSALPLGDAVQASRFARRAAESARAQLAYDEAVGLLRQALSICDRFAVPDHERAEVVLALGWASTESGQIEQGRDCFRRVSQTARELSDARLLARAALGQGGAYVFGEVRDELVTTLKEALGALDSWTDPEALKLRARLLARLAAALTPSRTTPEEPLALARRALVMLDDETDMRARVDVDVGAGAALSAFAPAGACIPVNERLLRNARSIGDRVLELRALTRLACEYLEIGNLAAAAGVSSSCTALGVAMGHPRYRWQGPLIRSMQAMPSGHFELCEQALQQARELAASAEDESALRCIEVHRFFLLLLSGRSQGLREQESATLGVVARLSDAPSRSALITGTVAAVVGDHALARAQLGAIGPVAASWSRLWRSTLADAAVLCGARAVYEPLYASFLPEQAKSVCSGPFAFVCLPSIARIRGIMAFASGRREEGERACALALESARGIGARAHIAWVELGWGEGLGAEPAAREHLERTLEIASELGMPDVARRARLGLERTGGAPAPIPAFSTPVITPTVDGRQWSIARAGRELRLKSVRGLPMLRRLLENPHQEIHALELAVETATGAKAASFDLGDAGAVLDPRARREYAARLAELREELEEAEQLLDQGRAERLRAEIAALSRELSAAIGLGSRERRAGSAVERARIVVQRRVREAIRKIADHDAELGRHLDWTVRTGTYCAYEPGGRKNR
jgi:tetratricopeptide (TPR) repeat protein